MEKNKEQDDYIIRAYNKTELQERKKRNVIEEICSNLTEAIKKAMIMIHNYEEKGKTGYVTEILHTTDYINYNLEERFETKE